jgi:hypothetical protein
MGGLFRCGGLLTLVIAAGVKLPLATNDRKSVDSESR